MKTIMIVISLFICSVSGFGQTELFRFYAGTYTSDWGKGIVNCTFNAVNGEIMITDSVKNIDNPSFLKIAPGGGFLYVVSEVADKSQSNSGFVSAYKIGADGGLTFLNKQLSMGDGPCHVDVSKNGKFVAVANYGGGTVSLFPLNENGSLQEATSVIVNKGTGPDKTRQAAPHAHSIKFSPFTGEVFNADLGTDKFSIFNIEANKLVSAKQQFVKMDSGAGPRHFDFHPNGKFIYVINELNSSVSLLQKVNGNWQVQQSVSTLPAGYNEKSYCADIHISANGNFLYGSNRGHNSIAVFEINQNDGKLKAIEFVPVEGIWPRNFAISPDGNYLLAANQRSGNITVFRINQETGKLSFTGKQIQLKSPVCIEFSKTAIN